MLNTQEEATRLCRGCQGNNLFLAIDLGDLPISNELLLERQENVELFPLALHMCADCSLGQVQDVVHPERLFRDYRYLSSMSSTFLAHAKLFCNSLLESGLIGADDFVVEIASNDGYLLRNFQSQGIRVLGVEPAKNISSISESLGIPTISEFFSADLAMKIREENGAPKLVIANNVLALGAVADFGAQNCQPALNLNRSTTLEVCTSARLTQNPCYAVVFILI